MSAFLGLGRLRSSEYVTMKSVTDITLRRFALSIRAADDAGHR